MHVSLCLLHGLLASLELGETTTDGSRLLGSHVKWHVLLALVELSDFITLLLVDHSLDACNRLSHQLDLGKLGCCTPSDLGHTELRKLQTSLLSEEEVGKEQAVCQIQEGTPV